ncbi:MAG TPA: hypothetical protein VGH99_21380 [Pseudonocardia sp.]|jgi:hypothetical protein
MADATTRSTRTRSDDSTGSATVDTADAAAPDTSTAPGGSDAGPTTDPADGATASPRAIGDAAHPEPGTDDAAPTATGDGPTAAEGERDKPAAAQGDGPPAGEAEAEGDGPTEAEGDETAAAEDGSTVAEPLPGRRDAEPATKPQSKTGKKSAGKARKKGGKDAKKASSAAAPPATTATAGTPAADRAGDTGAPKPAGHPVTDSGKTDFGRTDSAGTRTRASAGGPAGSKPRASKRTLLVAGLAALLVAVWVGGALLFLQLRSVDSVAEQRPVALAAAEKVAVDLTSISAGTAKQQIDSLTAESTGNFRQQIGTYAAALQAVLDQAQAGSKGAVSGSGIEQIDDSTATALIAVNAAISNPGLAGNAQPVSYRVSVKLQNVDGRWLADDVAFVG